MNATRLLSVLLALPAGALTLTSPRLTADIDERSGMVLSLTDRRDGTALLAASPDRYALQPDAKTEIAADERDDRVIAIEGGVLRAVNPRLPGVTITKRYQMTDRWLEKRVEFSADRPNLGLLKHTVTSTVPADFYRDGYLNNPSRHPIDYPYLFTKDLTTERPIRDSHAVADHHWAIFCNPGSGRGLAQYRFRVDDRYVHPLSSYAYEPGLVYGPTGWRVAVACKWLSNDRPTLSDTCRWHLYDGDHIAFHREYLSLPECRAEWDWPSPAWMKDVKRLYGWMYGGSSFRLDSYRQAVEAMDDGILMVLIYSVFPNRRDYTTFPFQSPYDYEVTFARLKQVVDGLHAISERIKVGIVTWQWGFADLDPVYRQHPEWTVHDGDGQPVFAASGWTDEKVYSQLLTPDCREHNLRQYREIVKRLDLDVIYMDTGQGGVTRFDWTTRWGAQDYDWADFYRGIRDAARLTGGATFFNGTPQLYSQYADGGYFEGMSFVKVRDWRAMADRLLLVKLYQPGDKWTIPLYWRNDILDEFINYCYLLGLHPGDSTAGGGTRRWPLTGAAHELAGLRLVPEAEARPCWWREPTEAEVYALSLAGGAMLNVYQHAKEPGRVTASCRLAPLGLDDSKPVQAWRFEPRPAGEVMDAVRLNEKDANDYYRRTGNTPYRVMKATCLGALKAVDGRVTVALDLAPEKVALVLLTQAPALAYEVGGRPTQLLLPPPAGVKVKTIPSDRPEPAELVARRSEFSAPDGLQSVGMVPDRSTPEKVNRAVREVGRAVAGVRVDKLYRIDCEHNALDTAAAELLPDRIRLRADMGDEKLAGFASAGIESPNLGTVRLALGMSTPVYGRLRMGFAGSYFGLTADYHTAAGYTRRVHFALEPCQLEALTGARPWWGKFDDGQPPAKAPLFVDLTGKLKPGGKLELELDLGRYAPAEWDGRVLFGPALESCGLGAALTVDIVGNGPAGERRDDAFSPLPVVEQPDGSVSFQGANVTSFEDGAELRDGRILFPPNACIGGYGFKVITWSLKREAASKAAELMVNFQRKGGGYELKRRNLTEFVKPGSESQFDLDLSQMAPADWNGTVRMRLRGDHLTAALIGNSTFQPF